VSVMLTPKQQRFVDEYLVDLNATQAAVRAGYSAKTANNNAARLMLNHGIREAIEKGKRDRGARTAITQDWALERLRAEAENTGEGSSHAARVTAIGLAMKHLGMMTEDKPHPDRSLIDLSKISDVDLDRALAAFGPLLSPEMRSLVCPGEAEATPAG
jgi:phage terminase small subunit